MRLTAVPAGFASVLQLPHPASREYLAHIMLVPAASFDGLRRYEEGGGMNGNHVPLCVLSSRTRCLRSTLSRAIDSRLSPFRVCGTSIAPCVLALSQKQQVSWATTTPSAASATAAFVAQCCYRAGAAHSTSLMFCAGAGEERTALRRRKRFIDHYPTTPPLGLRRGYFLRPGLGDF